MKTLLILYACVLTLGFIVNPVTAADWYEMDSGTTAPLTGVWGSSATDVFAVGGNSGIFEGTHVRQNAVIGAGLNLTRSTPVYDCQVSLPTTRSPVGPRDPP